MDLTVGEHIVLGGPDSDGSVLPHLREKPVNNNWFQNKLPQIINVLADNGGF